jgi:propionate CoA-transferase
MAPTMGAMILENKIQGYNFPQGTISHMFAAVAGRKPGIFTKIGLHTYIDPRLEGGRMNAVTTEDLVQVMELNGEEWLYYPAFPITVSIIRGTTADEKGNISSEHEGSHLESISMAQAARANGGIVIAQVKHRAQAGSLDPRAVRVPGICVDFVVVDPSQKQHCLSEYDPSLCGDAKIALDSLPPLEDGVRKIIGRRAAQELYPDAVVNVGVGMPDAVAVVASQIGLLDRLTFTLEHGLVGGQPAGGVIFGVSHNPEAMVREDDQFNFYDGGNLDLAFLGMAEADASGNVNVSKVGSLLAGCGGFINITQNARKVVFCGTFTAKGLDAVPADGSLEIRREGSIPKFVDQVAQVTFNGHFAFENGHEVLYITERAVFRLDREGMILSEVAPGVDLEKDILAHMGFRPIVDPKLKAMDATLFS